MRAWLAAGWVLLAGCQSDETEAAWLEGFSYRWVDFNHRLSSLVVRPSVSQVDVAVIGGTSTTGEVFDDSGECIGPGCGELPFFDETDISVQWAVGLSSPKTRLGKGTVELVATPSSDSRDVRIELPGKGRGTATAVIAGLSFQAMVDSSEQNPSCYDPRHGWLPRALRVTIGDVSLSDDGRAALVPVAAVFAAGPTLEALRVCLDAAVPYARARVRVDVVVVVSEGATSTSDVGQSGAFADDPSDPQTLDPSAAMWTPTFPDGMAGWRDMSWTFHASDPEDRGAYLRSLELGLTADSAYGWATNTSATMLSGFEVRFAGTVVERDVDVDVTHWEASADGMPADIDSLGEPVPFILRPLGP